jgi:hypothetical protein
MHEFVAENALTFARFVESAVPKCQIRDSMSFVNPHRTYQVRLLGSAKVKIPYKEQSQFFDEHYLMPIANELGLNLKQAAKLMALRNAWIANFQESEVLQILGNEIRLLITDEIARDYIVLTSVNWSKHPWMRKHPWMYQEKGTDYVSLAEALHCQQWAEYADKENQKEEDINFVINNFRRQKRNKSYASLLEKNADFAEHDIKLAKKRMHELHAEIEGQAAIIDVAMKPIRKFQNHERALKKRVPGRPKISENEDQQQRRDVAMKYVEQWVGSLMSVLAITSCGELAKVVSGQKMTWWRWLNKEMLPSSSSLESLLDVKVKGVEYPNTKLRDIRTSPALIDLISLIELV